MCARRPGLERVRKVLGLASHLAIQELHDAHRIRWPAVILEDEFRDPEVARADDSTHLEPLRVRLRDARGLDVVPAPDALARLRILEQCVLSVYVVLDIEVIRIGCSPVRLQCRPNIRAFYSDLVLRHRRTPIFKTSAIQKPLTGWLSPRRVDAEHCEPAI